MKRLKPLIGLLIALAVIGLAVWGFMEGREELARERERERPVKTPLRVAREAGEPMVVLDEAARVKSALAVTELAPVSRRRETQGFGLVLSVQELIDLRNSYAAARAQADKARAQLEASRSQYQRLSVLHGEEHNISDQALQAAQAALRSDRAAANAALEARSAIERSAPQQWGTALSRGAFESGPHFIRLSQGQEVLLQITLPAGTASARMPERARVQTSDGAFHDAVLLSAAPRTDPRLQGASYFYAAPPDGLLPGMTVPALLASGATDDGLFVPADAAVWWQGKAWVYLQKGTGRYLRRELPTDAPLEQGWFVPKDFAGAMSAVTRGAQLLLSEELRAQIQVGEEGENK